MRSNNSEPDVFQIRLNGRCVIFLDLSGGGDRVTRLSHLANMLKKLGAARTTACSFTIAQSKVPDAQELAKNIGGLLAISDTAWIISPGSSDRGTVVTIHSEEADAGFAVVPER